MLPCIFSITNHSMHYTRCNWVNHWCFIKSTIERTHGDIESISVFYVIKKQNGRWWRYLFACPPIDKWSVVTLSIRLSSNRSQVRSNQIYLVSFFKNSVTCKIVTICLISCLTDPLTRNQHFHATRQRGKIQSVFYEQVPLFECAQSWNIFGVQRLWKCL